MDDDMVDDGIFAASNLLDSPPTTTNRRQSLLENESFLQNINTGLDPDPIDLGGLDNAGFPSVFGRDEDNDPHGGLLDGDNQAQHPGAVN